MGKKLVVGPIDKGLKTDRTQFNIDNDSFPFLQNAYQWRGRVKRKRGTELLGRLQRYIGTTNGSGNATVTIVPAPGIGFASFVVGTNVFYDPGGASPVTLLTNGHGTAILDRTTGILTIAGSIPGTQIIYFPTLPVMGFRDLILSGTAYPGNLAFDTTYAYNVTSTIPTFFYDVSFYKNPISGTYASNYVAKPAWTPVSWNGTNYQQFWSVNYQGVFWVTNGIDIGPTTLSTIGMQFAPANTISGVTTTSTTLTITITNTPLIIGDFVFVNEWVATGTAANALTLNLQSGFVTAASPNTPGYSTKTITITFPFANIRTDTYIPGIIQYLTNRSNLSLDNIKWYDGDPTLGNPPLPSGPNGWVNFMPPLSQANYSIGGLAPSIYYLVGCRMIVPFKDRLLFIGPVVQTSTGSPIYLQDVVVYSQNGTSFYTASFASPLAANAPFEPTLPNIIFNNILTPVNQTATAPAFLQDSTGFGGFVQAGVDQAIVTTSPNGDVLIMGLSNTLQVKLISTGNDIVPFDFFLINSEFASNSTFSVINLDKGVLTRGNKGFVITSQEEATRFDLDIPDSVFELNLNNNGAERVTAARDFINEWIYFTYTVNQDLYIYPNQTLQYNYRDNSWAIFNESYTTYGQFKINTGITWLTTGYNSWDEWQDSWNSGQSTLLQAQVVGGNQQGFLLLRGKGTGEGNSLTIQNIVGNIVTSPDHTLNEGDYIVISGVLGSMGSQINGNIYSIATPTENTFVLNSTLPIPTGNYQGGGLIKRMYVPLIQTKQFPLGWELARKTRLGPQQYLFTTTPNGQIQLLIFLSQNDEFAYNDINEVENSGLIYSTVLYTCSESTNLGLTSLSVNMLNPFNTNLQMNAEPQTGSLPQAQTWHRINTGLAGDTIQIGFTMSDSQMRDITFSNQFSEIEIHKFILDCSPSGFLA